MQPARAGVIACAVIMTIATLAVIESAARDLTAGFLHGAPPALAVGSPMSASFASTVKFGGDL